MFHTLGAEQENDSSYIVVRDFGNTMIRCRLIVSLGYVYTCDTGFSKVDMYSGVRSFNALCVYFKSAYINVPLTVYQQWRWCFTGGSRQGIELLL